MVMDLFDTLPSVEPGFTRTRTHIFGYAEISRTLGGHINMEADKDEDVMYEWFVDYIDPTAPTN